MIVGGLAATAFEKSKDFRRGGACIKAGNNAKMVKMWN